MELFLNYSTFVSTDVYHLASLFRISSDKLVQMWWEIPDDCWLHQNESEISDLWHLVDTLLSLNRKMQTFVGKNCSLYDVLLWCSIFVVMLLYFVILIVIIYLYITMLCETRYIFFWNVWYSTVIRWRLDFWNVCGM